MRKNVELAHKLETVMTQPSQRSLCSIHNLHVDSVCLAETCRERLQCQLCVKKHQHKFYLDDKEHDKRIRAIR